MFVYVCVFLIQVVGLDIVDDESRPERRPTKHMPKPAEWTNEFNPAYSYYAYYCYANLYTLNKVSMHALFFLNYVVCDWGVCSLLNVPMLILAQNYSESLSAVWLFLFPSYSGGCCVLYMSLTWSYPEFMVILIINLSVGSIETPIFKIYLILTEWRIQFFYKNFIWIRF